MPINVAMTAMMATLLNVGNRSFQRMTVLIGGKSRASIGIYLGGLRPG